ncbi:MAG: SDR family NAD(P)-dependent oxidoreductase [Agriterribacter sp.]
MNRLKNKTAIVTGAAGGIGAATAKLFAQEGAKVLATDIQYEKLKQWVEAERALDSAIQYMAHDVTSEQQWLEVMERAISSYRHIDILVNNAGVFPGFSNGEDTTLEQWNKIIAINLTGPFLGCKSCIPHMRKTGGGAIVNIASIAGLVSSGNPAYCASKGGLRMLSKDLAALLAKDNIRVNSICPGAVRTPMTQDILSQQGMEQVIENMSPQARVANAVEIAYGALYLAAEESSFVTGSDLVIDGGAVAK